MIGSEEQDMPVGNKKRWEQKGSGPEDFKRGTKEARKCLISPVCEETVENSLLPLMAEELAQRQSVLDRKTWSKEAKSL